MQPAGELSGTEPEAQAAGIEGQAPVGGGLLGAREEGMALSGGSLTAPEAESGMTTPGTREAQTSVAGYPSVAEPEAQAALGLAEPGQLSGAVAGTESLPVAELEAQTFGAAEPGQPSETRLGAGALRAQRDETAGLSRGGSAARVSPERLGFASEKGTRELTQEELEAKFLQGQQSASDDIRPTVVRRPPKAGQPANRGGAVALQVIVNNKSVTLTGKSSYIFVDVFNAIDFDLKAGGGRAIVTKLNGETPSYTTPLKYGDKVEIYWEGQR